MATNDWRRDSRNDLTPAERHANLERKAWLLRALNTGKSIFYNDRVEHRLITTKTLIIIVILATSILMFWTNVPDMRTLSSWINAEVARITSQNAIEAPPGTLSDEEETRKCEELLHPKKNPNEIRLQEEIEVLSQRANAKLDKLTMELTRQLELWRDKMVQDGKEQSDHNMPDYLKNAYKQQQQLINADPDWIELRKRTQEYVEKYSYHPAPSELEFRQRQNCQAIGRRWWKTK